jgi:hypothetical protein
LQFKPEKGRICQQLLTATLFWPGKYQSLQSSNHLTRKIITRTSWNKARYFLLRSYIKLDIQHHKSWNERACSLIYKYWHVMPSYKVPSYILSFKDTFGSSVLLSSRLHGLITNKQKSMSCHNYSSVRKQVLSAADVHAMNSAPRWNQNMHGAVCRTAIATVRRTLHNYNSKSVSILT